MTRRTHPSNILNDEDEENARNLYLLGASRNQISRILKISNDRAQAFIVDMSSEDKVKHRHAVADNREHDTLKARQTGIPQQNWRKQRVIQWYYDYTDRGDALKNKVSPTLGN